MSLWWYWRHFSHLCMFWFHLGYGLFILLCDWMIHGCEIMDSAEVHCLPFYYCVNAEDVGCECPYLHAVIASRLWLFILLCDWMIHGCEIVDSTEVHFLPFYCCINAENAGCECPYLHVVIASELWPFYCIMWLYDTWMFDAVRASHSSISE